MKPQPGAGRVDVKENKNIQYKNVREREIERSVPVILVGLVGL
jgi:hypothetical protein